MAKSTCQISVTSRPPIDNVTTALGIEYMRLTSSFARGWKLVVSSSENPSWPGLRGQCEGLIPTWPSTGAAYAWDRTLRV